MVSQDRHEIYLIIAEYDDAYQDYIENENQPDLPETPFDSSDSDDSDSEGQISLMTMHQFGPWEVHLKHHMQELGEIILALMLQNGQLDLDLDTNDPAQGPGAKITAKGKEKTSAGSVGKK